MGTEAFVLTPEQAIIFTSCPNICSRPRRTSVRRDKKIPIGPSLLVQIVILACAKRTLDGRLDRSLRGKVPQSIRTDVVVDDDRCNGRRGSPSAPLSANHNNNVRGNNCGGTSVFHSAPEHPFDDDAAHVGAADADESLPVPLLEPLDKLHVQPGDGGAAAAGALCGRRREIRQGGEKEDEQASGEERDGQLR